VCMKAIAYYRVSTTKQGVSGLGLEAQQSSVEQYAQGKYQIVNSYIEVESGKKNNRPKLLLALEECKKKGYTLIIAKLDRLGRNVAFIANLMEAKVEFIAVDNPHANRLMLHLLAAFAEHEREMISKRTKEALKAAKMRGVKLGNPAIAEHNKANGLKAAKSFELIIKTMLSKGKTVKQIAKHIDLHPTQTQRFIKRLGLSK